MHTFFAQNWAILPSHLTEMLARAEQVKPAFLAPSAVAANVEPAPLSTITSAYKDGKKRKNGRAYSVQVITLQGPMFKRLPRMIKLYYGMHDTADVVREIEKANANPEVHSIVLDIDSPGGTVDGTQTLAKAVRESKKPVVAYVDGMAASAAYWVASQAKEIVLAEQNSMVGSVGTIYTHVNLKGFYNALGLNVEEVLATGSEDKRKPSNYRDLDEEDRKNILSIIDPMNARFHAAVKAGRKNIAADALTGKMYESAQAIELGMADRVGNLQAALNSSVNFITPTAMNEEFLAIVEDYRTQASELRAERDGLRSQLAEAQAQNAALQQQLAEANTEELQAQLAEAQQTAEQQQQQIADLQAQLDRAPATSPAAPDVKGDALAGSNQKPSWHKNPWNQQFAEAWGGLDIEEN